MARKKTEKQTELTEKEKELLQEIIIAYKSLKVMSRYTKWIIFIIFLLVLDFSRLMDALASIFTQKSNIQL
ncbi:hypothetical protein [Bartonella gabonensis]|uniref:hypothetical protein n=1 Tax=Bartonella gabonensis TaxID=2699889 RepID=UPI00158F123E|nr:hypothetical protein [Bartonella gabonensis]